MDMAGLRRAMRGAAAKLRGFLRADGGGIAVQMAFLALPLAVLAFGMVDVNRASSAKKDLQDALDAATLLAARSTAITNADLQGIGSAALTGQLSGKIGDATLTSSGFTADGSTVHGTATLKLAPVVANLWTHADMTVTVGSDVVRSMNKLEVALVLDNTGSMQGTKLSSLKTAATNFIDELAAAAARSTETNPVKIGIVPFSNAVRIASKTADINSYKSAPWMDVAGNAPVSKQIFNGDTVNRFTMFSNLGLSWAGCVESRAAPYDVQDTAPGPSVPATLFTPYFWPDASDGENDSSANDYLKDSLKYNNVGTAAINSANTRMGDNLLSYNGFSNNDKKMIVSQGDQGKYSKHISSDGPNKGCDMQAITRLETNWNDLKAKINAMNAVGETHIPLGMMWGWHVLSPNSPFGDGVAYNTPKTTKVVVLMTDGDNTYSNDGTYNTSAYDGYGFAWQNRLGTQSIGSAPAKIDGRLSAICTNMKNQGIVIYTVRVEVRSGSSTLLSNCATTPDKFYDVQSASNLNATFSAIAGSIQNLRISN
jgi:Flp pilus assembly protein TadG